MNDRITVVEEHPAGVTPTFTAQRLDPFRLELVLNPLGDRPHLHLSVAVDDDEVVGHNGDAAQIQDNDL